jgi:uncharacterized protein (TIGR00159 family)
VPFLAELELSDAVDMAIVAGLLWVGIAWLRNSRARLALVGLAALGALYLSARGFDLRLTTWLLQGFFAVGALVLVVVFQDDLRRLFERIAVWGLRRGTPRPTRRAQDVLVRACFSLAREKVGALIVLPGKEPLTRHMEGGVALDGQLSDELLASLFDSGSDGHDGAVVVHGDRVTRFACHLPLSTDWSTLAGGGTRHAAALGLSERSDALCLVVSEERGQVSIAFEGELRSVHGPDELMKVLRGFLAEGRRPKAERGVWGRVRRVGRRWREGLVATVAAFVLWSVAIPGADVGLVTREVPIRVGNLPDGYLVEGVDPPVVEVQLEGKRRDLVLASADAVAVEVDAWLVQLGRRTFHVGAEQVVHPEDVRVVGVRPSKIKLSVVEP